MCASSMSNIEKTATKSLLVALAFAVVLNTGCPSSPGPDRGQAAQSKAERAAKPFLAHDAKTGEYLGVVISECRDWESKKPISYKVQLKDGSEVEKSPDSITINAP